MISLRTLLFVVLFSSRAIASGVSPFQSIVDSWPWDEGRAEIVAPEADAAIVVTIDYKKASVVDDTDSYGIRFHKTEKNRLYGYWGKGKSRCGPNGGCSGVPRLENITKEGFKVVFNLRWSNKDKKNKTFTKSVDCVWTPIQKFEEDGFEITVTTNKKK